MNRLVPPVLILIIASTVLAQTSPAAGEVLAKQVDKLFEAWDKPTSAGCALGVIKDGKLVYERGYGMADLEHNAPNTPQTLFDIGSVAKHFTAMAVLLLAQQGKVSLDDDIHKYVPEVPDYGARITLSHLLYHTSGLRNHFLLYQLSGWHWGDLESRKDALETVARQKELNFAPGSQHSYTNTGYILLGEVVRRVSGLTLRDFVARNIFQPLSMSDSQIHDDVSLVMKNRAWGYSQWKNGSWVNNITRSEEVGDSNVYTTIEDFARWDQNFYDHKVGGAAVIDQMVQPGTLNSGRVLKYAAGLRLEDYRGLKVVRHAGFSTSRAEYLRFPDQHFSVICFCNTGSIDPSNLAQRVADIYLSDLLKPETNTDQPSAEAQAKSTAEVESFIGAHAIHLSPGELAPLEGYYVNPDDGKFGQLRLKDGKLTLQRRTGVENELVPVAANRFVMAGVPAKLEVSFEERYPQFRVMLTSSGENTTPFALVYAGPAVAKSPPLSDYSGAFRSDEANAVVGFLVHDGKLVLHTSNFEAPRGPDPDAVSHGWFPLEPVCADSFTNNWIGVLRFTRDSKNNITGFLISNFAGGVRHLQFQKQ